MDDAFDDEAVAPDAAATTDRYPHRQRDAVWVHEARNGSDRAFGYLYDAWFDRVFDLVARIVRDRDSALEVTQDAFLSAWRKLDSLADPGAFGGWLLRIARNAALNRQQKERRSTPVDDGDFAVMESRGGSHAGAPVGFALEDRLAAESDPERALEDAETRDLVWEAASALGGRDIEVLNLQLRHGLTPAEVGDVLGLNRNAANQLIHRVRGRFELALRARLLWRDGRPACAELGRLLTSAGVQNFSVEAVKVADKHAPSCVVCSERRKSRVAPAAMFGAIPVMAAPIAFKQSAAYALEGQGVPMVGSAFGSAASQAAQVAAVERVGQDMSVGTGGADGGGSQVGAGSGQAAVVSGSGGSTGTGVLAAVGVAGVMIIFLLVISAGRAYTPSSNEVVAIAPGATGVSGPPSPATGSAPEESATTEVPGTELAGGGSPDSSPGAPRSTRGGPPTSTAPRIGASSTTVADRGDPDPKAGGPTDSTDPDVTPPDPPPVRVSASLSVDPSLAKSTYLFSPPSPGETPILKWSVSGSGVTGVSVTGPGFKSDTQMGSVAVCPGSVDEAYCSNLSGSVTYTLHVFGSGGVVIETRTATLTLV